MNKTTKIFFLGTCVALEGLIGGMIGLSSSYEIFLILSAVCMCITPAFLIAGLARPIKKGRLGQRLQYCAILVLAEGILAGYLCQTKFGEITLYVAILCFLAAPALFLCGHFLPTRKRPAEEVSEEPPAVAEAPTAEAPVAEESSEERSPEIPADASHPEAETAPEES